MANIWETVNSYKLLFLSSSILVRRLIDYELSTHSHNLLHLCFLNCSLIQHHKQNLKNYHSTPTIQELIQPLFLPSPRLGTFPPNTTNQSPTNPARRINKITGSNKLNPPGLACKPLEIKTPELGSINNPDSPGRALNNGSHERAAERRAKKQRREGARER